MNIEKQLTFALAAALTKTAKLAQSNVLGALRSNFTIRNNWLNPGNAMGIKVLPASKTDLSTAIVTRADWLNLFEDERGIKVTIGSSHYLAIPTKYVKRNKKDIVLKSQRPRQQQNTFVKRGKSGRLIIWKRVRKGKTWDAIPLFILIEQAKIPHKSTVVDPTLRTFSKEFSNVFFAELKNAIKTAR